MEAIRVESENVKYTHDYIESTYKYETSTVESKEGKLVVRPEQTTYNFRTERKVPTLGVMLVGWGGNNGSTVTAAVLANRLGLSWKTKEGVQHANYYGSLVQSTTVSLGTGDEGEVYVPLRDMLPMVHPDDIVFDGWDISSADLAQSMARAQVLDVNLQDQLVSHMKKLKPRPSIYNKDFIAANQDERADHVIQGTLWEQVEQVRQDIREFKEKVEKVIVLWTANTERFASLRVGLNDTASSLLDSIHHGDSEISPSTLFAVASILEGCCFINGSPQNTFVPGVVELAEEHGVFIAGDDFKSGQTKIKSVLVDFLVNAGIKPRSIVSYNHLGNNDGYNLSAPQQFKSKEISKSNVVDDMVASNHLLFDPGESPDHTVVIKYVPHVGDSKRALDEYTSEILMGGSNTIVLHNTCEDSLLASPIILDLVILAELCQRIGMRSSPDLPYESFHPVLSILSYLCKAPIVPQGAPVVNALFKQRACIENVLRACVGLGPISNMGLEYKRVDTPHQLKRVNQDVKNTTKSPRRVSNGHASNGSSSNGHVVSGHEHVSNGHVASGHLSNGHVTKGNISNGHVSNGHVSNGKVIDEQKLLKRKSCDVTNDFTKQAKTIK